MAAASALTDSFNDPDFPERWAVKSTIVFLVDSAVVAVAALVVLLCIRAACVSLRRRFVYINGKRATVEGEPLGYWLLIVSWIGVAYVFACVVIDWYVPSWKLFS